MTFWALHKRFIILGAKLAEVQAELIVNLADSDGFIGVCGFKRRAVMKSRDGGPYAKSISLSPCVRPI